MAEDRLDRIERILEDTTKRLNNVAKEQELSAKEMKESRREMRESRREMKESKREMRELRRAQKISDNQINKLTSDIDKLKENVDGIGKGFGRITLGLTLPCVEKAFEKVGIKVFGVEEQVRLRKKAEEIEIDILARAMKDDKEIMLVIECVTYLRQEDVEMLFEKLDKFYEFFYEHRDKELIGAVAYVHKNIHAIKLATKGKVYILSIGDNVMEIKNTKDFRPRIYKPKFDN